MLLQIVHRKTDPVKQVIDNCLQVTCFAGKTSSEELAALTAAEQLSVPHNSGTESTVLTLIHFWWSQPDHLENPLCRRDIIHLADHALT